MMIATAAHPTDIDAGFDYPTPTPCALACDCGMPTGYYHESDCASRR
jgi:hypothetical protein